MNKSVRKAVVAIIIANNILIAFAVCGHILSKFNYSDHLDEEIITVDDRDTTPKTRRSGGIHIFLLAWIPNLCVTMPRRSLLVCA